MKLSVIVVNHNKCEMLRHTLNSLIDAGKNIDYEIFMVDNFSTDKSVEMVKSEFPDSPITNCFIYFPLQDSQVSI